MLHQLQDFILALLVRDVDLLALLILLIKFECPQVLGELPFKHLLVFSPLDRPFDVERFASFLLVRPLKLALSFLTRGQCIQGDGLLGRFGLTRCDFASF